MVDLGTSFSGFSVDDVDAARAFYGDVLGLDAVVEHGILMIRFADGHHVIAYPKGPAHVPATFTILNFPVDDVAATVAELRARGVVETRGETERRQRAGTDPLDLRGAGPAPTLTW